MTDEMRQVLLAMGERDSKCVNDIAEIEGQVVKADGLKSEI